MDLYVNRYSNPIANININRNANTIAHPDADSDIEPIEYLDGDGDTRANTWPGFDPNRWQRHQSGLCAFWPIHYGQY